MEYVVNLIDCKPGDILAKDVYWRNCLILPAKTLLTEALIEKLRQTSITNVTIMHPQPGEPEVQPTVHPSTEFQQEYQDNANVLRDVISDLAAGRELRLEKISGVFDSVYRQIYHNY